MAALPTLEITVGGKTATIDPSRIKAKESGIFAKATGGNIMQMLGGMSEDQIQYHHLCQLWWFARFLNGEIWLSYSQAEDDFPAITDMDQIKVEHILPEDDEADDGTPLASDDQ